MLYTIHTIDQLKPILIGFRKSQGLSQKDVASKLAISQQAYQVLESSPQNVTLGRIFKVFAILGVKIQLSDDSSISQSAKGKGMAKKQKVFNSKATASKEQ